ncbi:MAG TPA: YlxR family protein, partial [Devosia sp.]|nr:YlxR family protein [Devosia sp.]
MARSVDHDRQCALTRTVQPVSGMVRFVPDPDGKLVPDVDGRAPGRGVWVTARAD